jgi:putative membrane protein
MLVAAGLWFRVALRSTGTRAFGFPLPLAWIAATMLQLIALSGLMAFSDHLWYSTYAHAPGEWPLDAVADQQLAGVIMWLFGTPLLLAITLRLIARWFTVEERRARREAPGPRFPFERNCPSSPGWFCKQSATSTALCVRHGFRSAFHTGCMHHSPAEPAYS